MSRKKNLRRVSVLVTPQTLYNLERLADMAGYGHVAKAIDKLTRDHMLALSRAARLPPSPRRCAGDRPGAGSPGDGPGFLRRAGKATLPPSGRARGPVPDLRRPGGLTPTSASSTSSGGDKLTAYQVGPSSAASRYRYIAGKYAAAIGYDREKPLARCAKRRAAEGREDVGEEALSALVRYGTENRKKKNRRKA